MGVYFIISLLSSVLDFLSSQQAGNLANHKGRTHPQNNGCIFPFIYLLSLADVGYLPPESSRLDKCEDMTLNLILKLNVSYDF